MPRPIAAAVAPVTRTCSASPASRSASASSPRIAATTDAHDLTSATR
ncbi:MAG: hypothetical protein ACRDOL_05055 [Streptosporangiaceae bacterium]